ncbi:serine/arginine repetitive matrix protein 2-like [Amphibalanus amphitrite]|uniref:serine/arginine repetitive matrix protein 2-like n=1 Tax=Amphibalanus amphitrite TaxID=1232801 RepID=UPI001C916A49|nr:serine/arginine repetitive matrix protein 2-like [Amphibalanus amphitrite]
MALPSSGAPSSPGLSEPRTAAAPASRPGPGRWHPSQSARTRYSSPPPSTDRFGPPPSEFDDDDLDIDTALFARKRRAPAPPAPAPVRQPEPEPEPEPEPQPERDSESESEPRSPPPGAPSPAPRLSLSRSQSSESDSRPLSAAEHQPELGRVREARDSTERSAPAEQERYTGVEKAERQPRNLSQDGGYNNSSNSYRENGKNGEDEISVDDEDPRPKAEYESVSDSEERFESETSSRLERFESESLDSNSRRPSLTPSYSSSHHRSLATSPEPAPRSLISSPEPAPRSLVSSPEPTRRSHASSPEPAPRSLVSSPEPTRRSQASSSEPAPRSLASSSEPKRRSLVSSPEPAPRSLVSSPEQARRNVTSNSQLATRSLVSSPGPEPRTLVSSPESERRSPAPSPERSPCRLSSSLSSRAREKSPSPEPLLRGRAASDASFSQQSEAGDADYPSESLSDRRSAADRAGSQSEDVFGEFEDSTESQAPPPGISNAAVVTSHLAERAQQNFSQEHDRGTSSESESRSEKHRRRRTSAERNATYAKLQATSLAAEARVNGENDRPETNEPEKKTAKENRAPEKQQTNKRVVTKNRWTPPKVQLGSWTGYSPGHRIQLMEDEDYVVCAAPGSRRRRSDSLPEDEPGRVTAASGVTSRPTERSALRSAGRSWSRGSEQGSSRSRERAEDQSDDQDGAQRPSERNYMTSARRVSSRSVERSSSRSVERTSSRSVERTSSRSTERYNRWSMESSPDRETGIGYVRSAERATARSAARRLLQRAERSSVSPEGRAPRYRFGNVRGSPEREFARRARSSISPPPTDLTQNGDLAASRPRRLSGGARDPHVTGGAEPPRAVTGRRGSGAEATETVGTGGAWRPAGVTQAPSAAAPGRYPGLFKRTAFSVPVGWRTAQPVVKGFRSIPPSQTAADSGSEAEADRSRRGSGC